jgi:hypothetical protein
MGLTGPGELYATADEIANLTKTFNAAQASATTARTDKSSTNIDQTLHLPTWYHKNVSRFVAEMILATATPGAFLVRDATDKVSSFGGLYQHLCSLSIRVPEDFRRPGNIVKHYRIRQYQSDGWLELENGMRNRPQFPTIQSLVTFFGVCPPSRTDGVLLSFPCRRTIRTDDVNVQHSQTTLCYRVCRRDQDSQDGTAIEVLQSDRC